MIYRKATDEDLEKIWAKDIKNHPNDDRWETWKEAYIGYNKTGMAITFVAVNKEEPIGQITVILSTNCYAVKDRPLLCDGNKIANMNAFRIDKEFEGQGYISKLVKFAEEYIKNLGIEYVTIGAEAKETRNLSIYFHFGYTDFVMSEYDQKDGLVLYYGKRL